MSILKNLPCSLPSGAVPLDVDHELLGHEFATKLTALDSSVVVPDVMWRDLFALTGSVRTFYGGEACLKEWADYARESVARGFEYVRGSGRHVKIGPETAWVEFSYIFTAEAEPRRSCLAILSLAYEAGAFKIWVIRTVVRNLQNHPNVDRMAPGGTATAKDTPNKTTQNGVLLFDCAIIGGGQAGLSVAGRLAALGVLYVVLEKNGEVGDNWRQRYQSTKLHTIRESTHLPFDRTFPESYPEYLTKDDLAKGYKDWVQKYNINVWLLSTLQSGEWLANERAWTLQILRGDEEVRVMATHLVLAVGAGCQIPKMPVYPGRELFSGKIIHSVDYHSADAWAGKHGIVVGTANTAHDVVEDMISAGLKTVTMVQRSPTYVLPTEYYTKASSQIYNTSRETEESDIMTYTNPIGIARLISQAALHEMARQEPERFDRLEKAGFKLIRYGDIIYQIYERMGGHYMDVGASAKIANGLVKMKSDAAIVGYERDGLLFDDNTKLKADVVVFATGFVGNMKESVRTFFGNEVAGQVDDFWGLDQAGELKGAFKPSGHPNLWLHGGTCGHARFFSRFIALQIRAALDGTPFLPGSALVPCDLGSLKGESNFGVVRGRSGITAEHQKEE